jgi:ferredoxin
MKVTVDDDVCIGAAQCVLTAPDLFEQDDDGLSHAVDEDPAEDRRSDAEAAAAVCPARAIAVGP